MTSRIVLIVLCALALWGCKSHKDKSHLPPSNGSINSVCVVINTPEWNGALGEVIREHFAYAQEGLSQQEPIFFLHQVPPSVFEGNMRNSRNIIIVNVKKNLSASFQIKDTLFATHQKVGVFSAGSVADVSSEIQKYADSLITVFKTNELKESWRRFKNSLSTDKTLSKKFGISLLLPSVYKVVSNKDNFLWIERPIKEGNANLFVYTVPYGRISTSEKDALQVIKVRDSIGALFVPGREVPGRETPTHMITQEVFTPTSQPVQVNGHSALKTLGLWAIDGVALGGPFVNFVIDDKPNQRQIVIDGVVLATMQPKRDYIFELEAIIRSIKFEK